MNGIKFFPKNLEIEDKRVLLRLDLNSLKRWKNFR